MSIGTATYQLKYAPQRKLLRTSAGKLVAIACLGSVSPQGICMSTSTDNGDTWSAWSQITTNTAHSEVSAVMDANNNIYIVYYSTAGTCYFRKLTYVSGTQSWTVGDSVSLTSMTQRAVIALRSNGDIWCISQDVSTNGTLRYNVSTNDGSSFTNGTYVVSATAAILSTAIFPISTKIGIICLLDTGTNNLRYLEWDSSMSAVETIGTVGYGDTERDDLGVCKVSDSAIYLSTRTASGIRVFKWDGSSWDDGVLVSDNANDRHASLTRNTSGSRIYIVWSNYVGANQYNLVYNYLQNDVLQTEVAITSDNVNNRWAKTLENTGSLTYVPFIWCTGTSAAYTLNFGKFDIPSTTITDDYALGLTLLKTIAATFTLGAKIAPPPYYTLQTRLLKTQVGTYSLGANLFGTLVDSYALGAHVLYIEKKTDSLDWAIEGTISTGTEVEGFKVFSGIAQIVKVYVSLKDTGDSGNTIIDVNKNGTTIFADPGDQPTLAYNNTDRWVEVNLANPILIREHDRISIDIDDVAVNAEDLEVRVILRRLIYLRPAVDRVELLEDNIKQLSNKIFATAQFKSRIVFNQEMDTTVTPTITLRLPDGSEINMSDGAWTHTNLEEDTFVTDAITILSSYEGDATIEVSGGKGKNGLDMYPDTMIKEIGIVADSRIQEATKKRWTNQASVALKLNYVQADEMQFSMDDSNWSALEDYSATKTLDITDAAIGGTSTEETKTIYVRFKVGRTLTPSFTTTIDYATTLPTLTFAAKISLTNPNADEYNVEFSYPSSAQTIPIKTVNIYVDDVLKVTDKMRDIVYGCAIKSSDSHARTITLSAGYILTRDGRKLDVAEDTVVTFEDIAIAATSTDRIDLLYMKSDGTLTVVKGVYGLTESALPSGAVYSLDEEGTKYPKAPNILDEYIPLYYVYLSYSGQVFESGRLTYSKCVDMRKLSLVYTLSNLVDGSRVIKLEMVDEAGRTFYATSTVTVKGATRIGRIRAYTSSAKTTEIISGEATTSSNTWMVVP